MPPCPKNIVIVAHHYPPHITGVGFIAQNHAKRLAAMGHAVTVITSKTSSAEESNITDGVHTIRIRALNISERWSAPFPIFSPMLLPALFKSIRRADIVHIHDSFYMSSFLAAFIAWIYRKPIVLTQHVAMIAHPSKFIVAIEKIVYATTGALIFRMSDSILTYNDRVAEFLRARGVDKDKLGTMINGVDIEMFKSASAAEKKSLRDWLGIHPDKKAILFVGRFVPKKGLDKMLAARSDEYQIVCAGGDIPAEKMENVLFLGKFKQSVLAGVYQACDIFVLPSESEGFPLSVQEAMASGLPVVTTFDPGYLQYALDPAMIYFLDKPTEASVQNAIREIVNDNERLRDMGTYSEQYARANFSWPVLALKLDAIYDNLLKKINAKKIAIVSDAIYPYNKGGKEKRIYEITSRLAAQGYQVTIYCMQWWKGKKTIYQDGVIFQAISPYYPLYAGERRSIKEAVLFALNCFKLLNKKFDVIEVDHMPHLVLFPLKIVCLLKRKKLIVTWHEVWGKEYWKEYLDNGIMSWIAYQIEKVSSHLPDLIISVSEHNTKRLRNIMRVEGRIVTIHNGVNIMDILGNRPASLGADVIFAGRLLSHKNVDVLLRSINILKKHRPAISAFIVGEGPEKESLETLAKELGLEKNVSFLGFLEDQNELYRIMQASRIFVLPSTREGFGIVALEANACGMPFITIDHEQNAAKELVVNDQNGIVTSLGETALADAIEKLLTDNKERESYRAYAEKYDWNHIVAEIEKTYVS